MTLASDRFTLRLTKEEAALLDATCERLGVSRSVFLRMALRQATGTPLTELERRISGLEQAVWEIVELVRRGGISVGTPTKREEPQDDGGAQRDLQRSLRGILRDDDSWR